MSWEVGRTCPSWRSLGWPILSPSLYISSKCTFGLWHLQIDGLSKNTHYNVRFAWKKWKKTSQKTYCQCFCWLQKSLEHFPNFTTFTTITIKDSHTFQCNIVLKIFGQFVIKIRQWPMIWREKEKCYILYENQGFNVSFVCLDDNIFSWIFESRFPS